MLYVGDDLTTTLLTVKCDETKPACARCVTARRTCEGYDPLIAQGSGGCLASPTPGLFDSLQEYRSFAYFVERTSWQLAGFFDQGGWQLLLAIAQQDTAIRHAVIALGSLHETFEYGVTANAIPNGFTLQHYDVAIRQHVDRLRRHPDETTETDGYLTSCSIFVWYATI